MHSHTRQRSLYRSIAQHQCRLPLREYNEESRLKSFWLLVKEVNVAIAMEPKLAEVVEVSGEIRFEMRLGGILIKYSNSQIEKHTV